MDWIQSLISGANPNPNQVPEDNPFDLRGDTLDCVMVTDPKIHQTGSEFFLQVPQCALKDQSRQYHIRLFEATDIYKLKKGTDSFYHIDYGLTVKGKISPNGDTFKIKFSDYPYSFENVETMRGGANLSLQSPVVFEARVLPLEQKRGYYPLKYWVLQPNGHFMFDNVSMLYLYIIDAEWSSETAPTNEWFSCSLSGEYGRLYVEIPNHGRFQVRLPDFESVKPQLDVETDITMKLFMFEKGEPCFEVSHECDAFRVAKIGIVRITMPSWKDRPKRTLPVRAYVFGSVYVKLYVDYEMTEGVLKFKLNQECKPLFKPDNPRDFFIDGRTTHLKRENAVCRFDG